MSGAYDSFRSLDYILIAKGAVFYVTTSSELWIEIVSPWNQHLMSRCPADKFVCSSLVQVLKAASIEQSGYNQYKKFDNRAELSDFLIGR